MGLSVPVNDTVPGIDEPALFFTINVEADTVEACTASLKVAVIWDEVATFDAPARGVVAVIVGGVASVTVFVGLPTYNKGSRILSGSPVK